MAERLQTSTLIRFGDWQSRLHGFLVEHQNDEFGYGRMDCCLFVADAIRAMTGADLARSFRGLYQSRAEAMAAVKAYAGRPSVKAVAEKIAGEFGLSWVPWLLAQRGDMVLVKRSRDYSLGLVALNGRDVVVASPAGLWRIPLAQAAGAWQI